MKSKSKAEIKNTGAGEISEPEIEIIPGEFPLYRTYGVTRRYSAVRAKINTIFGRVFVFLFIMFYLTVMATVGFALWFYSGALTATVMTLIIFTSSFLLITRVPRARLKFCRRLKRLCRKNNYRLEFKRKFLASFSWGGKGELDFILKAGRYTYYARFATASKRLSTMTFSSKTEFCYVKHPLNNKFTLIFDFKDKKKILPISFPHGIDPDDKYSIKAIVMNPAPMNAFKNSASSMGPEPTGTGEKIYDYTIFNGTGFIETVRRNAQK